MKRTIITALAALAIPQAPVWADDIPACANDAALEFGAPEQVFRAMVIAEGWYSVSEHVRLKAAERGMYGPMGLGTHAINEVAGHLGTSQKALREEPCENFRGAAWWLMNLAGGDEREIWDAVTRYYYGDADLASYPATERVRAIYEAM